MKNHELIAALQKLPPDLEVFMSSDQEGNSFSWLEDVELSQRLVDDPYKEYIPLHPDDVEYGEYEGEDLVDAIYLWP